MTTTIMLMTIPACMLMKAMHARMKTTLIMMLKICTCTILSTVVGMTLNVKFKYVTTRHNDGMGGVIRKVQSPTSCSGSFMPNPKETDDFLMLGFEQATARAEEFQ